MHHQTKSSFSILQNYTSCLLPISNFNVKDWISLPLSLRKHPVPVAGRLGLFCVVFNLHHRPDWTSSHQRNTPLSMPVPRRLWLSTKAHLNVAGTIPWGPKLDLKGRSGEHQHPFCLLTAGALSSAALCIPCLGALTAHSWEANEAPSLQGFCQRHRGPLTCLPQTNFRSLFHVCVPVAKWDQGALFPQHYWNNKWPKTWMSTFITKLQSPEKADL